MKKIFLVFFIFVCMLSSVWSYVYHENEGLYTSELEEDNDLTLRDKVDRDIYNAIVVSHAKRMDDMLRNARRLEIKTLGGDVVIRSAKSSMRTMLDISKYLESKIEPDSNVIRISTADETVRLNLASTDNQLSIPSNIYFTSIKVSTSDGNIDIEGVNSFEYDLSSGSGNINLKTNIIPEKLSAESFSGKVNVSMPDDNTVSVNAISFNSDVYSDFIYRYNAKLQFNIKSVYSDVNVKKIEV